MDGGFTLPGEADPVWAGDVDRMSISLVAPDYDKSDAMLAAPAEGWVELSEMACDGSGSVLEQGDVMLPEHELSMATGRSEEHTSELQSLMRIPTAVFCLKKTIQYTHLS